MGAVEVHGYWPALEVVRTDRAPAPPVVRDPPASVADWVARSHTPWRLLLDQMRAADLPRARRYAATDDLITLVSRHAYASVAVLYPVLTPALRPYEPDLLPALTADLVAASHVMVRLEHLIHGDTHHHASAFPGYCRELRERLGAHADREESLLPIVGMLDGEQEARLAMALHEAERRAPTRPHPHALAHHTALRFAGPLARGIDVLRDVMDNRTSIA
jgi:hypothetical protein